MWSNASTGGFPGLVCSGGRNNSTGAMKCGGSMGTSYAMTTRGPLRMTLRRLRVGLRREEEDIFSAWARKAKRMPIPWRGTAAEASIWLHSIIIVYDDAAHTAVHCADQWEFF
ncbi:hypothetical protein TB1_030677 [Malus domestica]